MVDRIFPLVVLALLILSPAVVFAQIDALVFDCWAVTALVTDLVVFLAVRMGRTALLMISLKQQ